MDILTVIGYSREVEQAVKPRLISFAIIYTIYGFYGNPYLIHYILKPTLNKTAHTADCKSLHEFSIINNMNDNSDNCINSIDPIDDDGNSKNKCRKVGKSRTESEATKKMIPDAPKKSARTKSLTMSSTNKTINQQYQPNQYFPLQIGYINENVQKGSFSDVFQVKNMATNKLYALKRSRPSSKLASNMACLSGVAILNKLQLDDNTDEFFHKNIIKFNSFFFINKQLHQIFQLYPYGTFDQLMNNSDRAALNSLQILQSLSQLVDGISYIHSRNIIHLDLKPENIFIQVSYKNSNLIYSLKIGDFGIAVDTDNPCNVNQIKLPSGEPCYIAPEILHQIDSMHTNHENLQKVDVYSLGIILIELICHIKLPSQGKIFSNLRNIDEENKINWNAFKCVDKNRVLTSVKNKHDPIIMLMKNKLLPRMIHKNVKNRISSAELSILMKQIWNPQIYMESWNELLKLNLHKIKKIKNKQFSIFTCDEEKINCIPKIMLPIAPPSICSGMFPSMFDEDEEHGDESCD